MEEILRYFPNLDKKQIEQFAQLKPLYEDWNAKINVISRKDTSDFYIRHALHSLRIAKVQTFLPNTHILDVGTGGDSQASPWQFCSPIRSFTWWILSARK